MSKEKRKRKLKENKLVLLDHNGAPIKKLKKERYDDTIDLEQYTASTSYTEINGGLENNENLELKFSKKEKQKSQTKNEFEYDGNAKKKTKKKSHKIKKEQLNFGSPNGMPSHDAFPKQSRKNVHQWWSTETRINVIMTDDEADKNGSKIIKKKSKLKKKKRKRERKTKNDSKIDKTKTESESINELNNLQVIASDQNVVENNPPQNNEEPIETENVANVSTFAERFHSMLIQKNKSTDQALVNKSTDDRNKKVDYYNTNPINSKKVLMQPIHLRKNLGKDLTLDMLSSEKFAQNNVMCRNVIDYNRDVNNLSMSTAKLASPVFQYCSENPNENIFVPDVEPINVKKSLQENKPIVQFLNPSISDFNIKIFHPPD